jgi:hypothetical protein
MHPLSLLNFITVEGKATVADLPPIALKSSRRQRLCCRRQQRAVIEPWLEVLEFLTPLGMNLKKGGHLKKHNSKVKPSLKEHHIDSRLMYCLSMIDTLTITATRSGMYYQNMHATVHIDEKWFNLMALKRGCLLAEGEPLPYRTTHHKPHVEKVQFLCAIGRPHVLPNGEYFDGKIGCWPIGHWETYTRGGSVSMPKAVRSGWTAALMVRSIMSS